MSITFQDIKNNREVQTYLQKGNDALGVIGFTEHGFAHAGICAATAADILQTLGYDERTITLARIAGYMHDIGNCINREDHAQTGAVMAFQILTRMGMPPEDIAEVICAIGNHDEHTGSAGHAHHRGADLSGQIRCAPLPGAHQLHGGHRHPRPGQLRGLHLFADHRPPKRGADPVPQDRYGHQRSDGLL